MPGWALEIVVSGGQTGADQAGVSAAKFLNYTTGGRAPKAFMTEEGPAPWLAEFGLHASPVDSLRSRTYHNVIHSQGTCIFTPEVLTCETREMKREYARRKKELAGTRVNNPKSIFDMYGLEGGSRYTAELTVAHRKHLIINPVEADAFRTWVFASQVQVLNVAGSRESKAPGIFDWVYKFLVEALIPF